MSKVTFVKDRFTKQPFLSYIINDLQSVATERSFACFADDTKMPGKYTPPKTVSKGSD